MIPISCITQAMNFLPESYLWIIPNSEHGAHEGKNATEFASISKKFFTEKWKK
jgi:hypothetical protein